MAEDNTCCAGLFLFIFGLMLLIGGVQRFLLYQKINNTPTSKVRSAAVGLCELFGKALCKDSMESPVSKAKCVYWRIKGEYYKPGKHGGWRDIYNRASSSQFFLQDDTGKMLVEPKEAEIDIPTDFATAGHLSEGGILGMFKAKLLDPKALAFINSDTSAGSAFRSHSSYELRLTEWFIAEGDPLYVLGNAEPMPGASSATAHENLVMKKGAVEGIMYISDSGEKKVSGGVRNSMIWMLALGLILGGAGLALLMMNFGA